MTREETLKILASLKVAYPHSFQRMKEKDGWAMVDLWQRQFASDRYEAVDAAVQSLIATRRVGYSPTIGEVKEQMIALRRANEPDEMAAWALVSKACSNGIYGYREEFAKLPPEVQAAVGRPEQLREWAMMDSDTVQSVVASNFMRAYRTGIERQREREMLPDSIRAILPDMKMTDRLTERIDTNDRSKSTGNGPNVRSPEQLGEPGTADPAGTEAAEAPPEGLVP